MSIFMEEAKVLRASVEPHYNCAQSVFLPFAKAKGVEESIAFAFAANFGSGMKMASICGAITGALMALGLYGVEDGQTISAIYRQLKDNHQGVLTCAELLKIKPEDQPKKQHCDDMVYECVEIVESILKDRGFI